MEMSYFEGVFMEKRGFPFKNTMLLPKKKQRINY